MEVVVEYVLMDNFVIDWALLFSTNKILKVPISKSLLCLSAFLGAVFAVFSPLLNVSGVLIILAKLMVAFLMVFVGTFSFYKLFLRFVCFVLLTFLFGGSLIAVCYFLDLSVIAGANLIYFSQIPIGSVLGIGILFVFFVIGLFKKLYSHARHAKYTYKVLLTINNKTQQLSGFFDSGNTLKTKNDIPIIILKEEELKRWFNFDDRLRMVMGNFSGVKIKNPQKMEISGVGMKTKILVFDADNLKIENRNYKVAVGIDNSRRFKDFSLLLNNKMGESLC